jgi:mono/diheme cytochrome c family protein
VPRWIGIFLLIAASAALVPFACIARARAVRSTEPRFHVFSDMDNQGRYGPQQANPLFADGRAMRPPVEGTVARGQLRDDAHLHRGVVGGEYATGYPVAPSAELLARGRERYDVFCAPCHGLAGYGDGMVARRAERLLQGTWVPPASFHVEPALSRPVGHLFNTITNGIRSMPAYGSQIPAGDRWAIVAYVRALQRSQRGTLDDVPLDARGGLR